MPKSKQLSSAPDCRTREETADLADQFVRHGGMWFEWYKLAGINNLGDQRELIRRFLEDLGRELAPGDELPDPRVEDYLEAEWIWDHGPGLAEALEYHGFDSSGVLRIVHCAGRSGGGPAQAAVGWSETKIALEQVAIQLRQPKAPPVIEYHGRGLLTIDGQPFRLETTEGNVIEALVKLQATGEDDLVKTSGHQDARKILKSLCDKYPELGRAVRFPGGKARGGYGTTIRDARPA